MKCIHKDGTLRFPKASPTGCRVVAQRVKYTRDAQPTTGEDPSPPHPPRWRRATASRSRPPLSPPPGVPHGRPDEAHDEVDDEEDGEPEHAPPPGGIVERATRWNGLRRDTLVGGRNVFRRSSHAWVRYRDSRTQQGKACGIVDLPLKGCGCFRHDDLERRADVRLQEMPT